MAARGGKTKTTERTLKYARTPSSVVRQRQRRRRRLPGQVSHSKARRSLVSERYKIGSECVCVVCVKEGCRIVPAFQVEDTHLFKEGYRITTAFPIEGHKSPIPSFPRRG